ncbi:fungal-specific transcription factor domain-containing protein [Mycena epipterygia]|nr:fungal-specific transcription factor domain-containing protein [Mycena epipterygia]
MSLNEDNNSAAKKRKGHRPCDMCRRKKRRCDGGEPCGHCIQHEFICTYQQRAMQRTATTSSSYVHSLENRLKAVESLLHGSTDSPPSSSASTPDKGPGVELISRAIRGLNSPFPAPHSDDLAFAEITGSLQSLSLNNPGDYGFQGKSSQAMLVKAAVDLKSGPTASSTRIPLPAKPWSTKPWEDTPPRQNYTFPENDLMITLVSLYFDNINAFFPLLHRPTFEKAFTTNTHLCDDGFAGTLLLVCALGARYSDDTRVHLTTVASRDTAGWKYFDQVQLAGHPLLAQPTLYDLQCYCLAVQFLDRTSGARACWTLVGFGIRLSQDIGAHRLKMRTRTTTPEEELEKRAYWLMVLFDSHLSAALGRSIAIQSHDFDLALPLRCDDAYWEARPGHAAFSQPVDTPSLVEFFICQLSLNRVLSFTLKLLYGTNRSKAMIGLNDDMWEQKIVAELDSALNTWFDSVPSHLRWDPACPNDIFFDQSAALYCTYYLAQILIHRQFIPAFRRSAIPTRSPSLTICNNAARACSHVAEIQQRRRPKNPLIFGQTAVFTSGIVLLLNIWGGNRSGRVQDADLSDVHRCMTVLRGYKERWPSAGHLLDTLEQLLKVDHAPTTKPLQADYDPSPFVASDPRVSAAHSSAGTIHQLTSHSAALSAAYGLMLDDMVNHVEGPGEAPARVPALGDASSFTAPSFIAPHGFDLTDTQYCGLPDFGINGENADMNPDTVAIWSTAPSAFEVSDWDLYLSSMPGVISVVYMVLQLAFRSSWAYVEINPGILRER